MTLVSVKRTIEAPVDSVFRAVTDIAHLPDTSPDIVRVEFLSDCKEGIGTRFRETRVMNGKESVTELELTEFVDGEHARMIADSHGTIWDTTFRVSPAGAGTQLELSMDARPHKWLPKLLNPLFKGLFRKGLEQHLDAVQAYCEQRVQGRS